MTTGAHDEIRHLLGAFVVDSVDDPAEREPVEQHLAGCPECRHEVAEHRESLARLTDDAAPAPDPLWERIRAEIVAAPAPEGPPAQVVPLRRLRGVLLGAAAVAAAVALTVVAMRDGGPGRPAVTAEVLPARGQLASLTGTVSLFEPETAHGRIRIELSNVPAAPSGHHYAVWVLRPGQEVEMEPVGAFTPEGGKATLELSLPGPGEYVALDISLEEDGGSPEHSGTSLAGATLDS